MYTPDVRRPMAHDSSALYRPTQPAWRLLLTIAACAAACFWTPSIRAAGTERRPNIILILADNLGWGELGVYGGGILRGAPTPRLDTFAMQGLRLLNFNVEVSCSPTRSNLMTGRFAIRDGTIRSPLPLERYGLVNWEITLPQLLAERGYSTAMFGKWHLGHEEGRYPTNRGFDEWYGIPRTTDEAMNRLSPGYDPAKVPPEFILEGRKGVPTRKVREYGMEERRGIDSELVKRSQQFISARAHDRRPFFLYLALTQVHYPTLPSHDYAGRTGHGDFADAVVETDAHVGQLLDALQSTGVANDTIVVFASDNGPEYRRPWQGTSGYWRGAYHTVLEGSLRAPFMIRWPNHISPRVSNEMVHAVDVFSTLATFAGASVPTDRPIDGIDQSALFLGRQATSNRDGFPVYVGSEIYAVKWRDWKYHLVWMPDMEHAPVKLQNPYLFNILWDPKEETPRTQLEDGWVEGPLRGVMDEMQQSLQKFPPIPPGAPNDYVPTSAR